MEVPLQWKLSVTGNNQVKSIMNDLNNSFQRGQISGSEYADSVSKIGRESNKVNNISRYQNQIFLSMHPNINKLSRAFSTFASVARTTLSLMTSINTLFIAQNTQSSALSDITASLAENRRELNRTLDPERIQQLNEEYAILLAKEKELKDQDNVTYWEQWLNVILGAGLYLNIFKNHLFKLLPIVTKLGPALGLIANPFIAIGTAMSLLGGYIADFLVGLLGLEEWRKNNGKLLEDFFLVAIPTALGAAGQYLSNFFLNDLPTWASQGWKTVSDVFVKTWNGLMGFIETGINLAIKGFSNFINMIINGINSIIAGINKISNSKLSLIPAFVVQGINIPRIDQSTAPVQGPVQPATAGSTYITVQGSVITERQLMGLVDDKFKEWMKSRGFTGFQ